MPGKIKSRLNVYCMNWHINKSPSCRLLVGDPLNPFLEIYQHPVNTAKHYLSDNQTPRLYWQVIPDEQTIIKYKNIGITWAPMWDAEKNKTEEFWKSLNKSLKIIAFTEKVFQNATKVGLKTLKLQFSPQPSPNRVNFSSRVAMYWNRTGLISKSFLEKLCKKLYVEKIYFRCEMDSGSNKSRYYNLDKKCGGASVINLPAIEKLPYNDYLKVLEEVNIYIAPRKIEGVGLTYLEALARGCFVLGYNGITMNEYISSGYNGWLFKSNTKPSSNQRLSCITKYFKNNVNYEIDEEQDWDNLKKLVLDEVGKNAWLQSATVFKKWHDNLSSYAKFLVSI